MNPRLLNVHPLTLAVSGTLAVVAAVSVFAVRARLEAIRLPLFEKPLPSGTEPVTRTTRLVPLEAMAPDGLPIDLWAPPAGGARRHLVIYLPGWGNPRTDNALLCADLASHGYVVIALDDISNAPPPLARRDPRDTGPFDLTSDAALARSMEIADWRLNRMTARVTGLLDWLSTAPDNAHPVKLGTASVAVVGFSFGGSTALEMTRRDTRISAAVNLDGMSFGESAKSGWSKPALILNSDYPAIETDSRSADTYRRLTASLTLTDRALQLSMAATSPTRTYLVRNTEHDDFTDALFTPPLGALLEGWPKSSAARLQLYRATSGLIVGFLKAHLDGEAPPQSGQDAALAAAGIVPLDSSGQVIKPR